MKCMILMSSLFLSIVSFAGEVTNSDMTGMWVLREFYIEQAGQEDKDWCEGFHGSITYLPDGRMYTAIDCKSAEPGSGAEKMGGYLFYAGSFDVNGNTLKHFAHKANDPSLIKTHKRTVKIEGDHLILTGPLGSGKVVVVWELSEKY